MTVITSRRHLVRHATNNTTAKQLKIDVLASSLCCFFAALFSFGIHSIQWHQLTVLALDIYIYIYIFLFSNTGCELESIAVHPSVYALNSPSEPPRCFADCIRVALCTLESWRSHQDPHPLLNTCSVLQKLMHTGSAYHQKSITSQALCINSG